MIVPPGRSRPSRSAASIMRTATRSLIDPPGLKTSSFATIWGFRPAPIRERRTSGVSPIVSRIDSLISGMEREDKVAACARSAEWRGGGGGPGGGWGGGGAPPPRGGGGGSRGGGGGGGWGGGGPPPAAPPWGARGG